MNRFREEDGVVNVIVEDRKDTLDLFTDKYLNQFEEGTGSISYDEKSKTVRVSGEQNGYHVTITAEKSLGETITKTSYPTFDKKSDYKEEVLRLYNEVGLKQREIASRLNISQSLVSKLLK